MPRLVPPVVPAGRMRDSQQPTLTAPAGLTLRPWKPSDAPVIVAAYADPAIQQWHRRHIPAEEEARGLIAHWNEGWDAEAGGSWAIVRAGSPEVAGRVSLRDVDLDTGEAEVGYWILPPARGGGIATAAVIGLTRWAFGELGLHRLELLHSVENKASCRVAEKSGFGFEGTKRSALRHADGWHDMHLHARTG